MIISRRHILNAPCQENWNEQLWVGSLSSTGSGCHKSDREEPQRRWRLMHIQNSDCGVFVTWLLSWLYIICISDKSNPQLWPCYFEVYMHTLYYVACDVQVSSILCFYNFPDICKELYHDNYLFSVPHKELGIATLFKDKLAEICEWFDACSIQHTIHGYQLFDGTQSQQRNR